MPIAEAVREEVGDRYADEAGDPSPEALDLFAARGEELMLEAIRRDLERFRVRFDRFFSERELHEAGRVEAGIAALEAAGDAYRAEGAVWFRTSDYGDEKDRVLVRGDGETTYLASDVAYHLDKASRGHDLLLDVLGADHHGYIGRLRAVLAAGGHDPAALEVLIVQLVSLLERGEAKRMSKRAGTLVTLSDLLDDIGVNAARFFLVQRSHETPLDLDLDVAREQSQENPVYYVQYAHARAHGILARLGRRAGARRPRRPRTGSTRPSARSCCAWPTGPSRWQRPRSGAPPTASPPTWSTSPATSSASTSAARSWARSRRWRPSGGTAAWPSRRPSAPASACSAWRRPSGCRVALATVPERLRPSRPWYRGRPRGRSSVGRASASQAEGRGFETHRPLP